MNDVHRFFNVCWICAQCFISTTIYTVLFVQIIEVEIYFADDTVIYYVAHLLSAVNKKDIIL